MSMSVILGIVLIFVNVPLGWIGLVWFAGHAKKTGRKLFYFVGIGIYGLSWALLALGIFLCGKDLATELLEKYQTPTIVFTGLFLVAIAFIMYKKHRKSKKK
jgi:small-conductance mechanosensitive channel